jgi:hypothetical protein
MYPGDNVGDNYTQYERLSRIHTRCADAFRHRVGVLAFDFEEHQEADIPRLVDTFPNLWSLDCTFHPNLTDSDLKTLSSLSGLQVLNLKLCDDVTAQGVQLLAQCATLRKLYTPSDVSSRAVATLTQLEEVTLVSTTTSLPEIGVLSQLPLLRKLHVDGSDPERYLEDHSSLDANEDLSVFTQITHLDLTECVEYRGQGLSSLTQLHALNLTDCGYLTESVIRGLSSLTQLRSLTLTGCGDGPHVTDPTIVPITGETLSHVFPRLVHLVALYWTDITDDRLRAIGNHAKFLQLLDVNNSTITDVGLSALAASPQAPIQTLCVSGCVQLTDDGLRRTVSTLSQLQTLDLRGCTALTDKGLQSLETLYQLQSLDVRYCPEVTQRGVRMLASRLPTLRKVAYGRYEIIAPGDSPHSLPWLADPTVVGRS